MLRILMGWEVFLRGSALSLYISLPGGGGGCEFLTPGACVGGWPRRATAGQPPREEDIYAVTFACFLEPCEGGLADAAYLRFVTLSVIHI